MYQIAIKAIRSHKLKKESLNIELSKVDWNINVGDVQQYWNMFENKLIKIVDLVAPLVDHYDNVIKEIVPKVIKNKINKRNRLLKSFKKVM